jgi:hypothetical protein
MEKIQVLEAFEKCLKVSGEFPDEMTSIEMTCINGSWTILYRVWDSAKGNHPLVAQCTSLIGKLSLDEDLFWLRGSKNGFSVDVIRNKPCKIVGYKTERRPVTKIIETGDFVETKIPVTDCDLRKGTVDIGSYEPVEVLA